MKPHRFCTVFTRKIGLNKISINSIRKYGLFSVYFSSNLRSCILQFFSNWEFRIQRNNSIINHNLGTSIISEEQWRAPFQLIFPRQLSENVYPISIKGHVGRVSGSKAGPADDSTIWHHGEWIAKGRGDESRDVRGIGLHAGVHLVDVGLGQVGQSRGDGDD